VIVLKYVTGVKSFSLHTPSSVALVAMAADEKVVSNHFFVWDPVRVHFHFVQNVQHNIQSRPRSILISLLKTSAARAFVKMSAIFSVVGT
jgi:hypothetical protein